MDRQRPNITIFTSHRLLGDGLVQALTLRREVASAVVVETLADLRPRLARRGIDLLLVDVTQGIETHAMRTLATEAAGVPLLALGLDPAERSIIECGRAGFANFVSRDASLDGLCQAIHDAVAGRVRCSPETAAGLLRALYHDQRPASDDPAGRLTPREREVLGYLRDGLSNKEIAMALKLTLPTVKHHVSSIFAKLGISRRGQAIRRALPTPLPAATDAGYRRLAS